MPLATFGSERVKGDPERVKISLHKDANFYRCLYGGGMNLPPTIQTSSLVFNRVSACACALTKFVKKGRKNVCEKAHCIFNFEKLSHWYLYNCNITEIHDTRKFSLQETKNKAELSKTKQSKKTKTLQKLLEQNQKIDLFLVFPKFLNKETKLQNNLNNNKHSSYHFIIQSRWEGMKEFMSIL